MSREAYITYTISETDLSRIRFVMKRLYMEDRMTGDEMRDCAHKLECAVRNAEESRG